MRSRKEIEKDLRRVVIKIEEFDLIAEILLDMRDLLTEIDRIVTEAL